MSKEAHTAPPTATQSCPSNKKFLAILKDGRFVYGYLRGRDPSGNIVLQNAINRIYVGNQYGDIPLGDFTVKEGDYNLLTRLLVEYELDKERVSQDEILDAQRRERDGADTV